MKYLISLIFLIPFFGYSQINFIEIAKSHFQKYNIVGEEPYLDQESKDYVLYISEFTFKDEEHPCHSGVVIEKKSGKIVLIDNNQGIDLQFPYSDTFIIQNMNIYKFCAD